MGTQLPPNLSKHQSWVFCRVGSGSGSGTICMSAHIGYIFIYVSFIIEPLITILI